MTNPKRLLELIKHEETALAHLHAEAESLNHERRGLLGKSALSGEESRTLQAIETKLLASEDRQRRLQGRIAERRKMLPALEREAEEAGVRLEQLRNVVVSGSQELVDLDNEVGALYRRAEDRHLRANDLAQKLAEWVTEGRYLALRFDLSGSKLRLPGRPDHHRLWQSIRLLAFWKPTEPARYTDAFKELSRQRNVQDKTERRAEAQREVIEFQQPAS